MVMIIGSIQQTIGIEGTIQGEGDSLIMVDGRGCFYDGMDVLARVMLSLNQRPKSKNVTMEGPRNSSLLFRLFLSLS